MSRVLLVDDQPDNLEYLSAILQGAGFEVMMARHGEEALSKARALPPDAVISDLLMPIMDGYTLLSRWRTDALLKRIPFLIFTATYTKSQDKQLALDLGASAFLLKPQEPDVILRHLRQMLRTGLAETDGVHAPPGQQEISLLNRYNDALFRKLEDKTRQLEESNRELLAEIFERGKIAKTQIAILNALPAHIALIDRAGVIINVNEAWRNFAVTNVLASPDGGIGQNYLSVCVRRLGRTARGAAGGFTFIRTRIYLRFTWRKALVSHDGDAAAK
jgi:CheY-like chemotaxis protein